MTVAAVDPRIIFTGTSSPGNLGPFSIQNGGAPIPFDNNSDIKVVRYASTSATSGTSLVEGTDYTLVAYDADTGTAGSVTLTSPQTGLLDTERLEVYRKQDAEQTLDLPSGGDFGGPSLEARLDRIVEFIQELKLTASRNVRQHWLETDAISLPPKASRALKLFSFDANGNPEALSTTASLASLASLTTELAALYGIRAEIEQTADIDAEIQAVFGALTDIQAVADALPLSPDISTVNTLALLKAIDASSLSDGVAVAMLGRAALGDGGAGIFYWDSTNRSSEVTADPGEGIWIAPTSDTTGASGAWNRSGDDMLYRLDFFGAKGDCRQLNDCTINGTTTLSSASYTFTSADVGKSIAIMRGENPGVAGTANAITLDKASTETLVDNLLVAFHPLAANTGAVTINYDGGGALALVDQSAAALTGGELQAFKPVLITYDLGNTRWQIVDEGLTGTVAAREGLYAGVTYTTISSVSGGNAILAAAPDNSISGTCEVIFGTNDTTAYQNACAALSSLGEGGELFFTPNKAYWIEGTGEISKPFHWNQGGGLATIFVPKLPTHSNTIANAEPTPLLKTPGITHWNATDRTPQRTANTTATADVDQGDRIVTVSSTSGMEPGDFAYIYSDETQYDTGSIQYPIREFNKVERVLSSTEVLLQYPVQSEDMTVSGQTVTVMTYSQIDGVRMTGGPVIGHGFDVDTVNGGGVMLFYLRGCHDVKASGFRLEGISGYMFCGHFNSEVIARDCTVDGRPGDVAFVENLSGNYGCFAFHASRNTFVETTTAKRVRHLHDGFNTGTTGARNCLAIETRTSAYRTHLGCNEEIYENCRAVDCQQMFAPEALVAWIDGCKLSRGFGYGLIATADGYTTAPDRSIIINNSSLECKTSRETDEIDGVVFVRGPYEKVHIKSSELVMDGTSGNSVSADPDSITIATANSGDYCNDLLIDDCDIKVLNASAASSAILLGGTTGEKRVNGMVKQNRIWAKDATKPVEVSTKDAGWTANLEIVHNKEMTSDAAITADNLVVTTSGALDGGEIIHSNYSQRTDAFPSGPRTFSYRFADTSGADEFTASSASGRYNLNERFVTVNMNFTYSGKGSASGTMRFYDMPFPAGNSGKFVGTLVGSGLSTGAYCTINGTDDYLNPSEVDRSLLAAADFASSGTVDATITYYVGSIYTQG